MKYAGTHIWNIDLQNTMILYEHILMINMKLFVEYYPQSFYYPLIQWFEKSMKRSLIKLTIFKKTLFVFIVKVVRKTSSIITLE